MNETLLSVPLLKLLLIGQKNVYVDIYQLKCKHDI